MKFNPGIYDEFINQEFKLYHCNSSCKVQLLLYIFIQTKSLVSCMSISLLMYIVCQNMVVLFYLFIKRHGVSQSKVHDFGDK